MHPNDHLCQGMNDGESIKSLQNIHFREHFLQRKRAKKATEGIFNMYDTCMFFVIILYFILYAYLYCTAL